ncbi:2-succinyl-5-enolpyruvyl-6-hydroxy-3-cyclohexene-1-carboxylic-acid synthase [Aureitalea sp. L0-47]|uniref:2-succinyl-5-enolpyruvyl-6-hydroxy-3- cyclohexene-1-carboxylic-acid synthase n=1 Tax=Aureitalea sp. L0-47 TaxID=2816962 RepID=UPI00223793A9|nr:2-succinyl-5-enolpyruvyl-6-hydroxy-3-cyclohexene-1-carboxylic-acid synthase [Aureitalea sp. L0-47]MCW5520429.1 2-succinyl-5-enolpyruvyl-6-hydroxy-3-cyclohexene-1-carboxylic-acid synthase [Aureitalea sp. L0-47]
MNYSSKRLSQTITQLCLAKEIDHVVISPGSRNAPLTIGFTEHPGFKTYSIVDERCAAFFALGLAQQLKKPVAIVCTSGSALLNYYPAVAEAYYSDVPLVVISADRPEQLVEVGDGQTIKQENVFEGHILYSANCKDREDAQIKNETEINIALNTAIELRGPVHINAPFNEPLYEKVADLDVRPQHVPARISEDVLPDFDSLRSIWEGAGRKMIIMGVMSPETLPQGVIDQLAADPELIVFTETTSNTHHSSYFPAIDQLIFSLDDQGFSELQPEVLITIGGMVISKRIKAFLRKYNPEHHWHVDPKKAYDTYFSLTEHIEMRPGPFFESLLSEVNPPANGYRDKWLKVKEHRLAKHEDYLKEIPYSDFTTYETVFKRIPENYMLQIANSAAIRYSQLFETDPSVKVYCNRGTSGIDGSTSTAIGASVGSPLKTVFVTGDLSFFYDSNALWNQYIPKDFRIIIVNNSGGGIFRILPRAKEAVHFERFFETTHHLNAKNLCEMYNLSYASAHDNEGIEKCLLDFFAESDKPKVLEIFTPAEINDEILMGYFDFIR